MSDTNDKKNAHRECINRTGPGHPCQSINPEAGCLNCRYDTRDSEGHRATPERRAAWDRIMKLAQEHDLINFSYGGVAVLDFWKEAK